MDLLSCRKLLGLLGTKDRMLVMLDLVLSSMYFGYQGQGLVVNWLCWMLYVCLLWYAWKTSRNRSLFVYYGWFSIPLVLFVNLLFVVCLGNSLHQIFIH
jgi:hypothetical protein